MKNDKEFANKTEKKKTILVYGGPNICKPTHLVHLKSLILGSALKNILQYQGHSVLTDIHFGDSYRHLGKVIRILVEHFKQPIHSLRQYLISNNISAENIHDIVYAQWEKVNRQAAEDVTSSIYRKEKLLIELYQYLVDLDKNNILQQIYNLDMSFDLLNGESLYDELVPEILKKCEEANILRNGTGVKFIPFKKLGSQSKKGESKNHILLESKDGIYSWEANNAAGFFYRIKNYSASRIIFVFERGIEKHFHQAIEITKRIGFNVDIEFKDFELILGRGNRKITHEGKRITANQFLKQIEDKARESMKIVNLWQQEVLELKTDTDYQALAICVFKLFDLSHNPEKSYNFDIKTFFYKEARNCFDLIVEVILLYRLLHDVKEVEFDFKTPEEYALMYSCMKFDSCMEKAAKDLWFSCHSVDTLMRNTRIPEDPKIAFEKEIQFL